MRNYLMGTALLASLCTASGALADDYACFVPMTYWQTRDAVHTMIEAQGWTVRRIKVDNGCYEVYARDNNGIGIEVILDPETLAIIKFEFEVYDDEPAHRNKA